MQQGGRRTMSAPKRPAIRRIPPGAPRETTFPEGSGAELAPEGDAEVSQPESSEPSSSPISHVARRRSAPPAEVGSSPSRTDGGRADADEDGIELLAGSPDEDSRPIRKPIPAPTAHLASLAVAPSAVPVAAVDVSAPTRGNWRIQAVVAAGVLVTLVAGIGIGVALRPTAPNRAHAEAAAPVAAAPPPVTSPAPEAPAPAPIVEVVSVPRPSVGTVVGAEGHRLWVDGHLAEGFTAVVSCGHHLVQVGSAGTPRDVDVRCGQEITVSR